MWPLIFSVVAVQGYGFVPPSQVRPIPVPVYCLDKNLLRRVLPLGGPGAVQHIGSGGAACCRSACRRLLLSFVRHATLGVLKLGQPRLAGFTSVGGFWAVPWCCFSSGSFQRF